MSLKQFDQAEEHFLHDYDMAFKQSDEELTTLISYNLGLFYAEQDISDTAIRHLKKTYQKEFQLNKTAFLIESTLSCENKRKVFII